MASLVPPLPPMAGNTVWPGHLPVDQRLHFLGCEGWHEKLSWEPDSASYPVLMTLGKFLSLFES